MMYYRNGDPPGVTGRAGVAAARAQRVQAGNRAAVVLREGRGGRARLVDDAPRRARVDVTRGSCRIDESGMAS